MKYYLIHQENQLQIVSIKPELEIEFPMQYAQQILVSGDSIPEVFWSFHELPLFISNGH